MTIKLATITVDNFQHSFPISSLLVFDILCVLSAMCFFLFICLFFIQDIRFILFPIGLLISVVFLLATLATRYILPSNHHILHWRCQTFYVTCLLIGDLLLAFTQLFGRNAKGFTCVSIGMYICIYYRI